MNKQDFKEIQFPNKKVRESIIKTNRVLWLADLALIFGGLVIIIGGYFLYH